MAAKPIQQIKLELLDMQCLTAAHCVTFRRTVAENRDLIERSIEMLLNTKAALRQADVLLGNAGPQYSAENARAPLPGFD